MNLLRTVARLTAIIAMAVSVVVAVILFARIGLTTVENLEGKAPTVRDMLVTVIKEASANEMRAIATTIAIAAGIAIAWYKLDIFREFEPHLTITQAVESRPIGSSYALVIVTATLTNNSKVQVKPRRGYCRLAQTAPLDDETVVALYQAELAETRTAGLEQVGWPLLREIRREWQEGDKSIEPGEHHQETFQFIISRSVESVVALSVIRNPLRYNGNQDRAETWRCYTFHNVLSEHGRPGRLEAL